MEADTATIRTAWSSWLQSLPWDFFLTITFREPCPQHRAEGVLNAVGQHLCALVAPDLVFLASEPHRSNLTHLHGLLRANHTLRRPGVEPWYYGIIAKGIWEKLFEKYGRSQVVQIRSSEAVTGYCSKYVTKGDGVYGLYPTVAKTGIVLGGGWE